MQRKIRILIETPKYERRLPDVLDVEDVLALLETPDLSKIMDTETAPF